MAFSRGPHWPHLVFLGKSIGKSPASPSQGPPPLDLGSACCSSSVEREPSRVPQVGIWWKRMERIGWHDNYNIYIYMCVCVTILYVITWYHELWMILYSLCLPMSLYDYVWLYMIITMYLNVSYDTESSCNIIQHMQWHTHIYIHTHITHISIYIYIQFPVL